MGIIYLFSSLEGNILPPLIKGLDKVLHVIIYAVLGFLIFLSFRKSGVKRYVLVFSVLLSFTYGLTDEFHQSFVPGRIASFSDIISDIIGAFLGSYTAKTVLAGKPDTYPKL